MPLWIGSSDGSSEVRPKRGSRAILTCKSDAFQVSEAESASDRSRKHRYLTVGAVARHAQQGARARPAKVVERLSVRDPGLVRAESHRPAEEDCLQQLTRLTRASVPITWPFSRQEVLLKEAPMFIGPTKVVGLSPKIP